MTWILRGCPHCGGDTFLTKDEGKSWFENCLQCGYEAEKKLVDGKLQTVGPLIKQRNHQLVRSR